MTKAAAWIGFTLGLSAITGGIQGYLVADSLPSLVAGVASGLVLLPASVFAARGKGWAQAIMVLVAAVLVARFLPVYARTYRAWPGLVLVGLGSFTLTLGILGAILDRFRGPEPPKTP